MISLPTLLLARQLLGRQTISVDADRAEINAVLNARDELDRAIAEANQPRPQTTEEVKNDGHRQAESRR